MRIRVAFTRETYILLLLTLCAFTAGINVNSNLLLLVFTSFLSIFLVSPFLALLSLQGVTATRSLPERCIEGKSFSFSYGLRYTGWLPRTLIRIKEAGKAPFLPSSALCLERDKVTLLKSSGTVQHRGLVSLRGVWISTTFPFGVLRISFYRALPDRLLAVPKYSKVSLPWGGCSGLQIGWTGAPAGRTGRGEEFYGVRELLQGETPHRIHWKWTAKRHQIMVVKEEELRGGPLGLYLDVVGEQRGERFEELLRYAASVCYTLLSDGAMVTVVWAQEKRWFLGEKLRGLQGLNQVLDGLAVACPQGSEPETSSPPAFHALSNWLVLTNRESPFLPIFLKTRDVDMARPGL